MRGKSGRVRDHAVEVSFGVIIAACIIVIVWLALFGGDAGVHEWQGGSGPSTVCVYEQRSEPRTSSDGKSTIVVSVLYTVCRDAR